MDGNISSNHQMIKQALSPQKLCTTPSNHGSKQNHVHPQVGAVILYGVPIVSLVIESQERLCLAQISNTLLKQFSYNEIHNRRVALGITCVQCTPVQLEILRRAGAMPVSSRRCGMITRREAERLCKSFLGDNAPPRLPDDFAFSVHHECAWGCRGAFLPARYNSSRAKCIKCSFCGLFFSPNKFIFHSHRTSPNATYVQPDAANFNSWRRHMKLSGSPPENIIYAWEDVKAMFNGGTRKRMLSSSGMSSQSNSEGQSLIKSAPLTPSPTPSKQIKLDSPPSTPLPYPPSTPTPTPISVPHRVPPFPDLPIPITMMDYVWNGIDGLKPPFLSPYLPWFGSAKRNVLGFSSLAPITSSQDAVLQHFPQHGKLYHQSAFRPVYPAINHPEFQNNLKKPTDADISRKFSINMRKTNNSPKLESYKNSGRQRNHQNSPQSYPIKNEDSSDSNDSSGKESFNNKQENMFKCRPELLKAMSQFKSAEKESYSKILMKNDVKEVEDLSSSDVGGSVGGNDEDEDETVDIETTDDIPEGQLMRGEDERRERGNEREGDNEVVCGAVRMRSRTRSPEPSNQRIWTIARFSLEDTSRYRYDRRNCSPEKLVNKESDGDMGVMNLATGDNATSKIDCLTCCSQPLS